MVATITVTPHILTGNNPSCTPPSPGDWTISSSCTFTGVAIVPQSVIVNAGKELILAPSSKLLIDLKHYKLLVKKGGGVLIKKTAALRQVKVSDTGINIYYQLTDNLSGQGVTTDSSGNTVELLDYYPYGLARLDEKTGTLTEQRKYTGQEYDASTGLNYLNARYQNPTTGRFISEDPAFIAIGADQVTTAEEKQQRDAFFSDPQQLNSYSYARNNPLRWTDPLGLFNVQTGGVEKGDTWSSITGIINTTYGTNYTTAQIQGLNNVNYSGDPAVGSTAIPNAKIPDVTNSLNSLMQEHSKDAKINNPIYFYNKVKNHGDWDLKNTDQFSSKKYTDGFVYEGQKIAKDAPGNIHYGYVGEHAKWALFPDILTQAAGAAQILAGTSKWSYFWTYGDDPKDNSNILGGYYMGKK
jgi:RHS repeat-associated protein